MRHAYYLSSLQIYIKDENAVQRFSYLAIPIFAIPDPLSIIIFWNPNFNIKWHVKFNNYQINNLKQHFMSNNTWNSWK